MAHQSLHHDDDDEGQPRRGRLGAAIRRLAGMSPGNNNGIQDGTQLGEPNGYQYGAHQGARKGAHQGAHHGFTEGTSDEPSYGQQHGTRHGQQEGFTHGNGHGIRQGSEIEQALGLEFHVVDGLVLAYQPGQGPTPGVKEHAKAFLRWLQTQEPFAGNEVQARLLEDALYPLFCSAAGWEPYAWRTVAGHFRLLPGVKRRQFDGRTGGDRTGRMPIVYKIPRAKR